jgi:hypothetical protein
MVPREAPVTIASLPSSCLEPLSTTGLPEDARTSSERDILVFFGFDFFEAKKEAGSDIKNYK